MNVNNLPTQYIITSDNRVGVIRGQTETQIITEVDFGKFCLHLRFMKVSKRQVGTPSRSFRCVQNFSELESVK